MLHAQDKPRSMDVLQGRDETTLSLDLPVWRKHWQRILKKHDGIVHAWLALVDEDFKVEWSTSGGIYQLPAQFSKQKIQNVILQGRPFTFNDHEELISGGLFPISHGDKVVGIIGLISKQANYFKAETTRWISTLVEIISAELVSVNGSEGLRDDNYNISYLMEASRDVRDALPAMFEILASQLEADAITVYHYVPSAGHLEFLGSHGFDAAALAKLNFKIESGMINLFIGSTQPVWIEDLQLPHKAEYPVSRLDEDGFHGYVFQPLVAHDALLGIMEIAWRSPRYMNSRCLDFLQQIAEHIAYAIERTFTIRSLRLNNAQLVNRYNAMIEGLSRSLEIRDLETVGHTRRVSTWTMRLIEHIQMPAEQREAVRQGTLLHDIGKLGIPDAILLKPGSLTPQERKVMQQHVVYGYNILAPITDMQHTLDIALYHHERWDGKGYPHGLTREQIPVMARMFAVVDVFDALTSDRPYRTAWSKAQALQYLRQKSESQFDPYAVNLFVGIMEKWRG